ncbi:hypothetical protein DPMN_086403 [Dreissena polymorpha]|uniref:Uncharacterized protein n=1 Tax=Dreissena polymorpha TaxID=45954 RepID=A0A9D4KR43_DREPO|nr:hypothetical protein DPMN_086403 [Dreissena polymorpha]
MRIIRELYRYYVFICIETHFGIQVGSHCRSDQLDHPDHRNFPTKPDQARLERVYTTSSRPLVDNTRPPHDSFTTSTQPYFRLQLDYLDLYASPIRSQLDQVDLSSIATRSLHDQIVMVVLQSYEAILNNSGRGRADWVQSSCMVEQQSVSDRVRSSSRRVAV